MIVRYGDGTVRVVPTPRRTWKGWWGFVRYWLRCLAKDIERAKHDWEDQVEGGPPWRMIWGPRMLLTYHKAPGASFSTCTSKRIMPLEDINRFVVGNFKKVIYGKRKKDHRRV